MNIDVTMISLVLAIAGGALGLWWRIEARAAVERHERQDTEQKLTGEIAVLRDRLNSFELDVTRNFVPAAYQEKMEMRFLGSIDKLASRLEVVVSRIETMGNQLIRMNAVVMKVDEALQNSDPPRT